MRITENFQTSRSVAAFQAILVIVALSTAAVDTLASPYIKKGQSEFNFGQIALGVTATHTFWIHALQDDTLFIDTLDPGCGCMTVPNYPKVVPPGDSVAYGIIMRTESLRGNVVKKPSFAVVGDTTKHRFKLYAEVIVVPRGEFFPVACQPFMLDYSSYNADSALGPQELPFALVNNADEEITLRAAELPAELIDIELPDKLGAGETFTGIARVRPAFHKKEFAASLTLEFNESQLYRLTIPFTRRIERYLMWQLNTPEDGPK